MILMSSRLVVAVLSSALLVAGCSGTPAAPGGKIAVVAAAYPLQFLAERVTGDTGVVTNLTAPGAEPHDLELSARQLATLSSADAVVRLPGFQAAVDEGVTTAQPRLVIDADAGITLLPADGLGHDHAEDDHADAEDAHEHEAAHDPHVWLSPANMVTMAQTISSALASAHPELAGTLQANTATLVADLEALDAEFTKGLATCERREFITSHAAFAYLADRYHLVQIPIAGLDPGVEPTAARIAEVQQLARQHGATTIFFETLTSSAVATSLARDLGLATAVLDPLEGLTEASPGSDYLQVMRANLAALRKANACQ